MKTTDSDLRKISSKELKTILKNHQHHVNQDCDDWEDLCANLYNTDLSESDLHGVNLSYATLRDINLSKTDLHDANLKGALLINADLSYTNLRKANLQGADLSGANLQHACLCNANLYDSDLCELLMSEDVSI